QGAGRRVLRDRQAREDAHRVDGTLAQDRTFPAAGFGRAWVVCCRTVSGQHGVQEGGMTFLASGLMLGAAAWRFGNPGALLALAAVPVVVGLCWYAFRRQARALRTFEGYTPQDSRPSVRRSGAKLMLVAMALCTLTVAVARPQADPLEESVTMRGRDI